MPRGLAHGRISPCPALFPISFPSRAYKLVMTLEWCPAGARAFAIGTPASHGRAPAERPHLLQGRDERFDLEFVRRKAPFQPDAVRVLIRNRYPTPNLVSHMFQSMPGRLRRAQRPEQSCLLVARMTIRERQSPRGWSADPARGLPHWRVRQASPSGQSLGAHPCEDARRRFGAPCGDFWLGTRFRDRLRTRD
jgi:hypothetical protein